MGQAQEDIWSLIGKYLSDELSEKEKQKLQSWKESKAENQTTFDQVLHMWEQTPRPADDYHPEVDKGWQRFKFRAESEQEYYQKEHAENKPLAKVVHWGYQRIAAIAASVVLLLSAGTWWWYSTGTPEMLTLSTGENERTTLLLPDSSQVWLNENSQLQYAEEFNVEHRLVHLSGEAFFEIKEAEGRRFTIFSEGAKTEVIGTSFNLRAYPDTPVKVQVVSGKVAFSPADDDNAVFLEPGYEATLGSEKKAIEKKEPIENPNFRAWQNQHIQFQNTSLQEVIDVLEDVYHTDIQLNNPDLANCRYTATFEGEQLQDVLHVLSVTGNLSFERQGSTYMISGQGCQ
ncbi:transmembrane sensor [Catalinimonas alkaloidigena]|uniref:FecR family protein n=1 Tax=Catalinimonas alkaloidigena TaxID=1075417 RepID=UPI002405C7A2|nr:FecR domain-containing protein [Catalinimonas alkaloidigena]MDF9794809.1 transmembrane sensor [Catalinimonas alkaloidigena]